MGLSEEERDTKYNELIEFINSIKDEKLKKFILDYFEKYQDKIKIAPAAKAMHHNYIGGLLVHTLECVHIAEANMNLFHQKIDRDEAVAACILHDIGKIFE